MNVISQRLYLAHTMLIGRLEKPEKGASMTEYAILVAVMAGVVLAVVTLLGSKISTFINGINIHT